MRANKALLQFRELLLAYSQEPELKKRAEIERTLWREYGTEAAIFVLDMSGFSRLSHKYGVIHYLSMVRHMQEIARKLIGEKRGSVVKFEADNCFAMFENKANYPPFRSEAKAAHRNTG